MGKDREVNVILPPWRDSFKGKLIGPLTRVSLLEAFLAGIDNHSTAPDEEVPSRVDIIEHLPQEEGGVVQINLVIVEDDDRKALELNRGQKALRKVSSRPGAALLHT
jgi:hypothetical protein